MQRQIQFGMTPTGVRLVRSIGTARGGRLGNMGGLKAMMALPPFGKIALTVRVVVFVFN
jgi:hypothetical protein